MQFLDFKIPQKSTKHVPDRNWRTNNVGYRRLEEGWYNKRRKSYKKLLVKLLV
jgi:hypothetical protein